MTDLLAQKCVPCRGGLPPATDAEIAALRPQVPDWLLVDVDGIKRLRRAYPFKDFQTSMAFAQAVGDEAEAAGHHPILTIEWGKVAVEWWTHEIGGLHQNDFIMAAKTDAVAKQLA
ncbi:MAG: 4a-hydroxytetrahydrobiopterin dehydratase [Spirulina sp. SIO3F2]|nr:4a-hydroxytetrahydrobiopterin dehydratase [Spirulina sp. SIO3F2]